MQTNRLNCFFPIFAFKTMIGVHVYIHIYIHIRHRAARHQWSVSNALVRFTDLGVFELF